MGEHYNKPDRGWMGDRSRGAGMGRSSDHLAGLIVEPCDSPFTLRHVRLNSGGYDSGGAYWGHHQRLYWWAITQHCEGSSEESSGYFRARDRKAAKEHIKGLHEHARFYR